MSEPDSLGYDVARVFRFPKAGAVSPTDPAVRKAIYKAHSGTDFWCRSSIQFEEMILDHVLPKSMAGPDNVFNLVPTGSQTNSSKGEQYDPVGTACALAIIRIHYGWKILSDLTDEFNKPPWWRIDPESVAPPAVRSAKLPCNEIEEYLETHRRLFAERFQPLRIMSWRPLADELMTYGLSDPSRRRIDTQLVIEAWKRVVRRNRSCE